MKIYKTGHQMGDIPNALIFLMLAFFPFLGICLIFLGVYLSYISILEGCVSLFLIITNFLVIVGTALFFLLLGWVFISSGLARYQIEDTGVFVKYPLQAIKKIPWHEFQQVCICYAAFTTRGQRRATTVICFVKKGEQKNVYGRWKTDNPFRYKKVISVQYIPELYEGIIEKCPFKVVDLRDSEAYRLI